MRATFVYAIQQGYRGGIKIGISSSPAKRIVAMQTANASHLILLMTIGPMLRAEAQDMERDLHHCLRDFRIRGEWFHFNGWRQLARMEWRNLPEGSQIAFPNKWAEEFAERRRGRRWTFDCNPRVKEKQSRKKNRYSKRKSKKANKEQRRIDALYGRG